jgi:HPt (histidine-containing phosphotransfer) domain-containing protein
VITTHGPIAAPGVPQTVTPSPAEAGVSSVFTGEELLEACEGDDELVSKLISLFNESTPEILDAIRDSIDRRDGPALARGAHKLLSSVGALGARRAQILTARLEEQGQGNELEGARKGFANLEREINKIYAALAAFAPITA